jgi:hypothetical protein
MNNAVVSQRIATKDGEPKSVTIEVPKYSAIFNVFIDVAGDTRVGYFTNDGEGVEKWEFSPTTSEPDRGFTQVFGTVNWTSGEVDYWGFHIHK